MTKSHSTDYIKRQAKSLKRKDGISHSTALDFICKNLGFQNWNDFRKRNSKTTEHAKECDASKVLTYKAGYFQKKKIRPNASMPINMHKKVGEYLKCILVIAEFRQGVFKPINFIRCTLEDWMENENTGSNRIPCTEFSDIYFHEVYKNPINRTLTPELKNALLENITNAKKILDSYYHPCPPLDEIHSKFSACERAIDLWFNKKII